MSPEALFEAWGAAWLAPNAEERLRIFRECCTEDVEFVPPDERPTVRGVEELAASVTAYTANWPEGTGFSLVRPPESHHDWSRGYVRWEFPTTSAVGCDIIRIQDGKIAAMVVFAETGPPPEPR